MKEDWNAISVVKLVYLVRPFDLAHVQCIKIGKFHFEINIDSEMMKIPIEYTPAPVRA